MFGPFDAARKRAAFRVPRSLGALVGLFMLLPTTGCGDHSRSPRPQVLTLDAFASAGSRQPGTGSSDSAAARPAGALTSDRDGPDHQSSEQVASDRSAPDSDEQAAATGSTHQMRPGTQVYVDGVVGQVSGRPIFIDTLLEPVADQLRREAQRNPTRQFVDLARQIVDSRLTQVVLDELVFAESEASLTTQQQQGLLAMLRSMRERTIATDAGVRLQAEQRLLQEHGVTLDQYIDERKRELLIAKILHEKIESRVIVSWKDVEREYERRKDEFNPRPTVTLKRLSLSNADQGEVLAQVTSRLAAGESFDAVASSVDQANTRMLEPLEMKSDDVSDIEINEAYKPALRGLSVGQTTRAIELEGRTVWLHVASIEQPPARSLYEVQRQLTNDLLMRRRAEQRERYIRTLLEKGIYDQLEEMSRRALVVAVMRYGR